MRMNRRSVEGGLFRPPNNGGLSLLPRACGERESGKQNSASRADMTLNWTPPQLTKRASFPARTVVAHAGRHAHLDWVVCAKRLSGSTCDKLIALGCSFPEERPTVVGHESLPDHRVGYVHMLPCLIKTQGVYRMLWDAALDATKRHYQLSLSGITRMPHYVEYHGGFGHFHWHNDYSHESLESPRKLTVIIQLSESSDYEGGNLEVFGASVSVLPRERGTVVCLPSFVPHRVTAVTSGVRKVLVAWIAGPRLA
jgi:PKHD-type hydroxylase